MGNWRVLALQATSGQRLHSTEESQSLCSTEESQRLRSAEESHATTEDEKRSVLRKLTTEMNMFTLVFHYSDIKYV